ncbi:HNH endonuclease [Brevibacillus sp. HB1.3]|uniref:HNH endonuclease n=1 Tax=Brevibacillus sp. HB1.3 TaxID=2738842 RepID=UPI00155622D5|nr:HNH endonuclease [Brevibacillus sp. HB1.3]NQF13828.1 HNH endonuclease [Brevibacillus sp. HB1.3]
MSTNLPSKSDNIRQLHKEGKSISEISKILNIRYQHAYNVVNKQNNQGEQNRLPIQAAVDRNDLYATPASKLSQRKNMGTGMFSRINYQLRRGMKELYLLRNLSETEWEEIKAFFNHKCAYCGTPDTGDSRNGLVPDHLIAVAENGDFVLGNVIAACHLCNDKRGKKPWKKWLEDNYNVNAPVRVSKIESYLERYPYTPPAGPWERLTESEMTQYFSIINDWQELWLRAQKLRDQISARRSEPTLDSDKLDYESEETTD